MRPTDLVRLYPELFHMAADGSWPSIERHGLLSTSALLRKWELPLDEVGGLSSRIRLESSVIEHAELGRAVIRDQKPIHRESLAGALIDMSVEEWLDELNARVFFFLQRERLQGLLTARSYRGETHTVITVDTASLVDAHADHIQLCRINSGFAQRHSKARRGRDTFQAIERFSHPKRESASWPRYDIAELCVVGGVPDIRKHVIRVERMQGDQVIERLA